jgi:ankyrin repeat protein
MRAVFNNHIDVVKILLKKGADVHSKDNDGETALMYADNNVAGLLKRAGAKR